MQPPLGLLLTDVARLLRRRLEAALEQVDTGLTSAEARAVNIIRRMPGRRQGVLAELMGIEPMTLVGHLDRLERAGIIRRVVDPADRRARIIELTEAARPVLLRIDEALVQVRSELTAGLDDTQAAQLHGLLLHVLSSLCDADARPSSLRTSV
ncbi:MarR family winged helix-turn-helix transcriptional regulator [Pannonibacter sp. SL95]|uniref:MarR family winged helix-turn-helix transcriptional regulator n=1 Tax=Pannonibacter sp. SL95 TaxID=2995153 RepID=UPI002275AF58|nr:MarR family transcriptional regulator [Pannonibacter sp. SL95]MCY1706584.1 MarR family transcriptional regulator [Pannonibacter sp. SL95]